MFPGLNPLRRKRVLSYLAAVLLVAGVSCGPQQAAQPARERLPVATRKAPPPVTAQPATNLVAVLNETRAANGIGPVWESKQLDEAAKIQADWQAQTDTLRHDGPPTMPLWLDRLKSVGIEGSWTSSGEICAMGQEAYWPDGRLAIDYDFRTACGDWLASPRHRAILLDPRYTHAGAEMSQGKSGKHYSTAVFLRQP